MASSQQLQMGPLQSTLEVVAFVAFTGMVCLYQNDLHHLIMVPLTIIYHRRGLTQ